MRILPISFGNGNVRRNNISHGYLLATTRQNPLSDIDFDIIADTIRNQNLKNQMNFKIMNLKKNIDK